MYLTVNREDKKAIYYFETSRKAEEMAKVISGSKLYDAKNVALNMLGLKEEDIEDGRVAMELYSNTYLYVKETPYAGCYSFRSSKSARTVSKRFNKGVAIFYKNIEDLKDEVNIKDSDIQDGGLLLRGSVLDWCDMNQPYSVFYDTIRQEERRKENERERLEMIKKAVMADKKETGVAVEKDVVKVVPTEKKAVSGNTDSSFVDFLNVLCGEKYNVVEITLVTGEVLRVACNSVFYFAKGVNSKKITNVDTALKNKDIISLCASRIESNNGYLIIYDCDDEYSPNVVNEEGKKSYFVHAFDCISICEDKIVKIVPKVGYSDLEYEQVLKDEHKVLYEDLISKTC